jgi:predicted TIM-barrel fold metal-dependent hydrolase
MFSSDYPHWDGDAPDFAVRQFPEGLRARIMGGTAAELYGLA